jgi:signal transduction histidine kinase
MQATAWAGTGVTNDMNRVGERHHGRAAQWLSSPGPSGARLQATDWSATPLGPLPQWPQSLRTALSLCLSFPSPACLVWGPARSQLFNDAYESFCAARCAPRPGQDFAECWNDSWPLMRAPFQRALAGEVAFLEIPGAARADGPAPSSTLSLLPLRDEADAVGGILIIVDTSRSGELARAEDDLAALDYAISHDLHAPVRTMQEMARIMATDPSSGGVFLEHFVQAAGKLNQRLDGLVRFRTVSRCAVSFRRVDVADIVRRLVTEQRGDEHGQRVSVVIGELPDAAGDYELIQQVFATLLRNAFKFTRHALAPRIEIGARADAHRIVYFVNDNGAGFEMKYASKLFGLFQRLHPEAQFEGTGVELALARRIVERHGGTMWAEGHKGQGASFQLTLPALEAGSPSQS